MTKRVVEGKPLHSSRGCDSAAPTPSIKCDDGMVVGGGVVGEGEP